MNLEHDEYLFWWAFAFGFVMGAFALALVVAYCQEVTRGKQ